MNRRNARNTQDATPPTKKGMVRADFANGGGGTIPGSVQAKDLPWETLSGETEEGVPVRCFEFASVGNKRAISHTETGSVVYGTDAELELLHAKIGQVLGKSSESAAA